MPGDTDFWLVFDAGRRYDDRPLQLCVKELYARPGVRVLSADLYRMYLYGGVQTPPPRRAHTIYR